MGIPVVLGARIRLSATTRTAPKVAVINEAAVRKYFPNENPIGTRFGSSPETVGADGRSSACCTTRSTTACASRAADDVRAVPAGARPRPSSSRCAPRATPASVIGAVREAVRQIDPNLPITDVSTQIEQVEKRFAQEKLFAQAYTLFGGLALLLASIGLFGLMSYSVSRRTNEIGIRMALGAQRQDVLRLVMRESMMLVVIGDCVVGLAIALASSRLVATLLFGLPPTDADGDGAGGRRDGRSCPRSPATCRRGARRGSIRWWRCTTSSTSAVEIGRAHGRLYESSSGSPVASPESRMPKPNAP